MSEALMCMGIEALSFEKKNLPKKYQDTAVAVYHTLGEARDLASALTKDTGIEHCVDIDNEKGVAIVYAKPTVEIDLGSNCKIVNKEMLHAIKKHKGYSFEPEKAVYVSSCDSKNQALSILANYEKVSGKQCDMIYGKGTIALFPASPLSFDKKPICIGDVAYHFSIIGWTNEELQVHSFDRNRIEENGFLFIETRPIVFKPGQDPENEDNLRTYFNAADLKKELWTKKEWKHHNKRISEICWSTICSYMRFSIALFMLIVFFAIIFLTIGSAKSLTKEMNYDKMTPEKRREVMTAREEKINQYEKEIEECQREIEFQKKELEKLQEYQD